MTVGVKTLWYGDSCISCLICLLQRVMQHGECLHFDILGTSHMFNIFDVGLAPPDGNITGLSLLALPGLYHGLEHHQCAVTTSLISFV